MNENKNSFSFPFLLGLFFGAVLVFFLATKKGRKILNDFLEERNFEEKLQEFIKNFEEREEINGKSDIPKEHDHIRNLQEKGRLFGRRFFRGKKPL